MEYLALALIILVAYLVTLVYHPSKIKIQILDFSWSVVFTTKDKSGDA